MTKRIAQTNGPAILKKPFDVAEMLQLGHGLARQWFTTQQSKWRLAELESIVDRRTEELRAANEKLLAEIARRKELEHQLRQAQKMDALGQLAAGVAHDFNNLLCVIRGNTELALMESAQLGRSATDCLKQVTAASDRAASLTRQLLAFGRKQAMQPRPIALNEAITNLSKMLIRIIGEQVQLHSSLAPGLPLVQADPGMIEQVLLNLVVNARDAMPEGGQLVIATQPMTCDESYAATHSEARLGEYVCLTITDSGVGIPPENLARIFEPFFTTKEPGKGTGLGLATAYGIVKQHEGWIEVSSKLGAGSVFRIFLPCAARLEVPVMNREAEAALKGGTETLLLVEDEEPVRALAKRVLRRLGYTVLEANSGSEALVLWECHTDRIDLVLTDVVMPGGITGPGLVKTLKQRKPGLKYLYMSAYGANEGSTTQPLLDSSHFLEKPYHTRTLAQTVRDCLDRPGTGEKL